MGRRDELVVLACRDLESGSAPVPLGELVARLRRKLPSTPVLVIPGLCDSPSPVAEVIRRHAPRRVVAGCRAGPGGLSVLAAQLGRSGVAATGTEILDLRPGADCSAQAVLEHSVTLLAAAAARLSATELESPARERTRPARTGLTRRAFLRVVDAPRWPVAVWRPERCGGGGACTACVAACPEGAMRQDSGRVIVDGGRCSGCGACVAACRSGAMALPGADLAGLGAGLSVLVRTLRRGGPALGVAISCRDSTDAPRAGEAWLSCRVPSLEMVTAGWVCQLLGAGVNVRLVDCGEERCVERARGSRVS